MGEGKSGGGEDREEREMWICQTPSDDMNSFSIGNIHGSPLGAGTLLNLQLGHRSWMLHVSPKNTHWQMAEQDQTISDSKARGLSNLSHHLGLPSVHFNF